MAVNKLASALKTLKRLHDKGKNVFKTSDIRKEALEIAKSNGFLKEYLKGWYYFCPPGEDAGDSAIWNVTWKEFVAAYCQHRFKNEWYLAPELSLLIHSRSTISPIQVIVHAKNASNNVIQLRNQNSLMDYRSPSYNVSHATVVNGLRVLTPEAALIQASDTFFKKNPVDAQVVLAAIDNPYRLSAMLMENGKPVVAGRLAGVFRAVGNGDAADVITRSMKEAGYRITETNPLEETEILPLSHHRETPFETRLRLMWASMRGDVISSFPPEKGLPSDSEKYLRIVQEIYKLDAYHSLSIEGYQVTEGLIQRVASGEWSPDDDKNTRNALAAKGYKTAFDAVKESIRRILAGENAADTVRRFHQEWYRQLFAPSVTAKILTLGDLGGYRNGSVYIKSSLHVPPDASDARNGMYTLMELLKEEPSTPVRVVLGHFIFVYIHPYFDGNGRMGRFIMNALMASGGYPWTVIPVNRREEYLAALEKASVGQDIKPFALFIADCMSKNIKVHPHEFQNESLQNHDEIHIVLDQLRSNVAAEGPVDTGGMHTQPGFPICPSTTMLKKKG